ncbi:MAG: flagellin lysine-N-methylase [Lachnospiraceae bacterium]|jgi:lysine-N-methylase|nr:flagellin lysine-N-methylase [Lachnospiraceae bacterium]
MRKIYPDYYENFICLADKCTHCCCIGWEIDIDDETYKRYMTLDGPIGERVRNAIIVSAQTRHFALDEHGRCPLLNENGLCSLCLEYGEESLCGVCHMYPRFAFRYGCTEEMSLSMSCEEAARLIITDPDPVKLISSGTDTKSLEFDEDDDEFCSDDIESVRLDALRILQNRKIPIEDRACCYLHFCSDVQDLINIEEEMPGHLHDTLPVLEKKYIKNDDIYKTLDLTPASSSYLFDALKIRLDSFDELEILGNEWSSVISKVHSLSDGNSDTYMIELREFSSYIRENESLFEQLLVYFTTRYFMRAVFDCDIVGKAKFAASSYLMIRDMAAAHLSSLKMTDDHRNDISFTSDKMIDICRIYSGEVEHSEDNIDTLNDEFLFDRIYDIDSLSRLIMCTKG